MKWIDVFDYLQAGGRIRRKCWQENGWIEIDETVKHHSPYLVDQDGEEYELDENEFRANDWEYFEDEPEIVFTDLSDEKMLFRLKLKTLSAVVHYARMSQLLMNDYAEQHNSVVQWGDNTRLKYHIAYSYITKQYYVEHTWNICYPTMVYFYHQEVAQNFIKDYQHMLDGVQLIEKIRGALFNRNDLTREELIQYNDTIERLSTRRYY